MGILGDRLQAKLRDLDSQIDSVEKRAAAEVARLKGQKAALKAADRLLTKDIEDAVAALQKIGVINGL